MGKNFYFYHFWVFLGHSGVFGVNQKVKKYLHIHIAKFVTWQKSAADFNIYQKIEESFDKDEMYRLPDFSLNDVKNRVTTSTQSHMK